MERVVWCIEGMRHFGELASDVMGVPLYADAPVPECDIVHIVGMYDPPTYEVTLAATKRARKRVIHWCGTDVERLQYPEVLPEAIHVCDSENLRRELAEKGVDATTIPWPAVNHFETTPLPAEPSVAVYFGGDGSRYGADTVAAIQQMLPGVRFENYMYGHYDAAGMQRVVDRTRVYLRLTRHDGGAMSAKEYMEAGRRAVITQDLPFARVVRSGDLAGIISALEECLAFDQPDSEAAEFWRRENSPERFLAALQQVVSR